MTSNQKPTIILKGVIDSHLLSFKAWEFETMDDILVSESGETEDLFRLEFDKLNEKHLILVSSHNEWCVHEDATVDFDLNYIVKQCTQLELTCDNIAELNVTHEFLEYVLEEEKLEAVAG